MWPVSSHIRKTQLERRGASTHCFQIWWFPQTTSLFLCIFNGYIIGSSESNNLLEDIITHTNLCILMNTIHFSPFNNYIKLLTAGVGTDQSSAEDLTP